jgi:hypothetical protein
VAVFVSGLGRGDGHEEGCAGFEEE